MSRNNDNDTTKQEAIALAKRTGDKKAADYLGRLEVRGGKGDKGGKN